MKKISSRFWLILLVTTLFFNLNLQVLLAQQPNLQITSLQTEVLPEYDTPDILVINTIQLRNSSDTEYSGDLKWIVPGNSKTHIVVDNSKPENYLQYNITPKDNDAEMNWKLETPIKPGETRSIHLEYYYNNFQGSGDKTFSFEINQLYPISSGQLYIIQPTKATNFKITPDIGSPMKGEIGPVYLSKYASVEPGQKKDFTISYTKSDPNPSVTAQNSGSSNQNQSQNQSGSSSSSKGMDRKTGIYIIAGLGVIIVILTTRIILNNQRVSEISAAYDDDDEEYIEDIQMDIEEKKVQLEHELACGTITEEEYAALLDELEIEADTQVNKPKKSKVRAQYKAQAEVEEAEDKEDDTEDDTEDDEEEDELQIDIKGQNFSVWEVI